MNTQNTRTAAPAELSSHRGPAPYTPAAQSRLAALALSVVLTLTMLVGVNTLATLEEAAPQMAQTSSTSS